MKPPLCIVFLVVVICLLQGCGATQSCWQNSDCPAYQNCTAPPNQVCTYTNPCVCSTGILSIVTGDPCPLGFLCQVGACLLTPGSCQYEGNVS